MVIHGKHGDAATKVFFYITSGFSSDSTSIISCMHTDETTEMKTPLLIALFQFWHMLILEVPAIQTQCLS